MVELSLSDINFHHNDKKVLDRINFNVKPGELVCLVGPSGCGKSTLLRLISGLTPLQSGAITVGNTVLADNKHDLAAKDRQVGLVFQHPSLFPHLTVGQNIAFGIKHLSKEDQQKRVKELLQIINLIQYEDRYPHTLSGGQQQRVALARALAPEPKVMLLDEPFSNLDYRLRRDIAEEVISVLKEAKIPILMVTHDPEEALMMADRMVLMSDSGAIKQIGEPELIHNHPVDIEAAAFFGPINRIPAYIEKDKIISPLGELPAKPYLGKYKHGQKLLIVTRPEGLCMSDGHGQRVKAVIRKIRHTGVGWLINAEVDENISVRFHHIYGDCPKAGDNVCLSFKAPHVFVFKEYKD